MEIINKKTRGNLSQRIKDKMFNNNNDIKNPLNSF